MEWEGWPNARASRFVDCRPHRWHVQEMGTGGPRILLIHGAGAGLMSYRKLLPLLARNYRAMAVDLPGHGLSRMGTRMRQGLDPMAQDLAALLAQEGFAPDLVVGHSAGAAVALRLATLPGSSPRGIVGLNAALAPFKGMAGWLFPAMARMLALNPLTAHVFARLSSSEASVRALLNSTGSRIDAAGVALYRRLIADPAHVDGTLAMMSQWRLERLLEDLPLIGVPVLLLTGANDRVVPPSVSAEAARRLPAAQLIELAGLGHLAHEEAPEAVLKPLHAFAVDLLHPPGRATA